LTILVPMRVAAWNSLTTTLKQLSGFLPPRQDSAEEAQLYYRRACLAATEERYDVALIFCAKAVGLNPGDLATRLLIAQIHDYGLHDVDGAVAAYRKVIALAAYEGDNPYCFAAREAIDNLVRDREIAVESGA
jgi:tetratricopeptide (TPR) repeat protein